LWARLRGRPAGVRFRRQYGIGPSVIDFYAPSCQLAVELDGESHFAGVEPEQDAKRNAYLNRLNRLGILVVRFTNVEVREQVDAVCAAIHRLVREGTSSNSPLEQEEDKGIPLLSKEGQGEVLRTPSDSPLERGRT